MKGLSALLWVAGGGAAGAVARFVMARACARVFGISFPWGTFLINISGSFALGLISVILAERVLPHGEQVRLAVAIGFLGAYTTFSTYEYESNQLIQASQWWMAAANLVGSVLVGLLAVRLGIALGRR